MAFTAIEDKTISYRVRRSVDTKTLSVGGSPVNNFLVKFNVTGLGGRRITAAKLRLYCTNGSVGGGKFYTTSNTWTEENLTWGNAPEAYNLLGSLQWVFPGRWYEIDATKDVREEGTYSFRATSRWWDGASYSSSEGNHPPQLVVKF
jgi:hypothetical protein